MNGGYVCTSYTRPIPGAASGQKKNDNKNRSGKWGERGGEKNIWMDRTPGGTVRDRRPLLITDHSVFGQLINTIPWLHDVCGHRSWSIISALWENLLKLPPSAPVSVSTGNLSQSSRARWESGDFPSTIAPTIVFRNRNTKFKKTILIYQNISCSKIRLPVLQVITEVIIFYS